MKINPDDPKWTAYVLGELSPEERAEVEKELESSAAAREIVDEIRLTTAFLKDELAIEAPLHLQPEQRSSIRVAAAEHTPKPRLSWRRLVLIGTYATAAAFIIATISLPSMLRSRQAATPASAMMSQTPAEVREAILLRKQVPPPEGLRYDQPAFREQVAATADREKTSPAPAEAPAVLAVETAVLSKDEVANDKVGTKEKVQPRDAVAANEQQLKAQAISQQQPPQQTQQAPYTPQQQFARPALVPASPAPPIPAASMRQAQGKGVAESTGFLGGVYRPAVEESRRTEADLRDRPRFNTESYDFISENPFIRVTQDPLATFSTDVDTASYANMRRFLSMNQLPPKDSVRIEEFINYFTYDYAQPAGAHPIAAHTEVAAAPWNPQHRLVRIGIKGKEVDMSRRPASNLVFLIDVSGSMESPEKLPLVKSAMKLLIDNLRENDRIAMVVYAGSSGMVLPSTSGNNKEVILRAVDNLTAGGSTNGASGIQLAYDTAVTNFIRGGINRVVLMTDGDFNVGITNQGDLTRLIEDKAGSGVFLSVLGFGMGNYKDSTLEKLADKGNGNYAYIDTLNEARKVLVEEMGGTMMTIAKDVKIQIEFNPAQVNAYRLIGYENRVLRHEDFNNDQKDAGDMGAGHTVTALFEIVPNGVAIQTPSVDPLRYQQPTSQTTRSRNDELLNLKIRYKEPEGSDSKLLEIPLMDRGGAFGSASVDFRFTAAVAGFGMVLRDSPNKGQATLDMVIDIAEKSRGTDRNGYREEFVRLARKVRALKDLQ